MGDFTMGMMSAVVKKNAEQAEFAPMPQPECGPGQVLIKVRSAALCGTDMHIFEWNAWARSVGIELPYIMGHECCGDVMAVGEGVTAVKVGDKVVGETHIPCGHCYQCMNGEQHICANLKMFGIHTNGCFAQYAVIPAVCARPIPREISYDIGAVMEPLGTAVRAASEMQVAGANVMVLGCGPIGLFAVAAALSMGASSYLSTKSEETTKNPLKASVYTGTAYILTVLVLIFPYLVLSNYYVSLACTLVAAIGIIAAFNYYIAVARDEPFKSRFLEMAGLSLSVAAFSFLVGFVLRAVFGVDV